MGVRENDPLSQLSLPPGFRFHPTDEELLVQYLCRKVAGHHFSLQIIAEIDLYKYDPWDLPSKAMFGGKEWYFFSPRERKYPNGSRPNRVAGSGYWKATGTDKVITTKGRTVGIKKALVFYVGKAPKGTKTNWIMHEYRISEPPRKNGSTRLDDWVLCRIYKKSSSLQKAADDSVAAESKDHSVGSSSTSTSSTSHYDDVLDSLQEIDDRFLSLPKVHSIKNLQHLGSGNFDWATLAGLTPLPELAQQQQQQPHVNYQNDIYAPAPSHRNVVEEEVQSGVRAQRPGLFQLNSPAVHGFSSSLEPFFSSGGGFGFHSGQGKT